MFSKREMGWLALAYERKVCFWLFHLAVFRSAVFIGVPRNKYFSRETTLTCHQGFV